MDFSNRSTQTQAAAPGAHATAPVGGLGVNRTSNNRDDRNKLGRIATMTAVAAVAILLVGTALSVGLGSKSTDEQKYVDSSKLQAVFLNTGQVYFGKVKTLNDKYLVVNDIYYLQTSSTGTTAAAANTSVSLVKLGCELHSPLDQMVINRTQVTFWENLQDTGQVAKAVATFQKANPSGQKCSDQSAAGTSTNSVQGAANSNAPTGTSNTSTPSKP